jgi:hypothetical protein
MLFHRRQLCRLQGAGFVAIDCQFFAEFHHQTAFGFQLAMLRAPTHPIAEHYRVGAGCYRYGLSVFGSANENSASMNSIDVTASGAINTALPSSSIVIIN